MKPVIGLQYSDVMMEYTLQPATPENLEIVLTWIATPESLKLWGGPSLTFPPCVEQTWHEMSATSQNTFALIDVEENIVGFGQVLLRAQAPCTVHLARIITSPSIRGKGIGRVLCQQLIQVSSQLYHPSEFTLNVYKNNTPAFKLYTSLGFVVVGEDRAQNWFKMSLRPW